MFSKEKLSLVLAELFGTAAVTGTVLVVSRMFGLGTEAWYTAISTGVVLILAMATVSHISGAHVNPAVTIGMWTMKKIETTNAIVYIAAQMLGGLAALLFYNYATNSNLASSAATNFDWRAFWVEATGAMVFGMGIAATMVQKLDGYWAAFTMGMSLSLGMMLASLGSQGYINPAISLGTRTWSSAVVLAPVVGVVVGMNLYSALFTPAPTKKKRK
ncbi:aquaporin [Candidatus Saccharibacteria bacterium]|nr:aquaporin [Candidatus Saccharibacteria bacterium]